MGRCMVFSVIIHYPKGEKAQQELAKKIADVHAQTVIELVKSMSSSTEQKVRLINEIKKYIPK
mgnify:CR=1 FL=1|jgi:hypothetical protein